MNNKQLLDHWHREGKWYMPIMLILFSLTLFLLLFNNVKQNEVNLQEGDIAEETIRANKTVENKYETEEKKKLAAEAIVPDYIYNDMTASDQITSINQLFTIIQSVEKNKNYAKKTSQEKIAEVKRRFEALDNSQLTLYQSFPNRFYELAVTLSKNELENIRRVTTALIDKYMKMHIRDNTLANTKQQAIKELSSANLSNKEEEIAKMVLDKGIVVNEVANVKKTNERREQAKNNVRPVMIYQGEIIVREGEQITRQVMEKLKLLGLTNTREVLFPMEALVMAIAFQVLIIVYTASQMSLMSQRRRFIVFYSVMMILSVVAMKFLQLFQSGNVTYFPFLFPMAFTPLVLNIFINRKTAILTSIFQTVFAMFVFYHSIGTGSILSIVLSYMVTGLLGSLVKRKRVTEQLLPASLWLIVYPILFQFILMVYQGMDFLEQGTWLSLLCTAIGCVLSFLLTIALHPYIELILTDDSAIVLNELSNPNQPLLKQLLEEAPGTYHHSMMVANLSANAVAEIGGHSMIARVGCYYHDIGKVKHANFFVENLPAGAENPHNFLLPEDSKQIIFSHITEGIKMLKEAHMPQSVIDICAQHHGTTLMRYFYVEAKERNSDVTEEEFRYPGPKPQTKEAAVVSIADSSEAAVRAMGQPTNEKIAEFVHNLINSRIEDGQFDECEITMKELRIVEKSIVNGLCSSFHSRIQYPELKKDVQQEETK